VAFGELTVEREGEPSARVRERVVAARALQRRRLQRTSFHANAQLGPREIARWCRLDDRSRVALGQVAEKRGMSPRGVHRLLKVARTLADLGGRDQIARADLMGAIDFRHLDQEPV
jgi:magnesium chelatase family protein